jgi:hypothetical protein
MHVPRPSRQCALLSLVAHASRHFVLFTATAVAHALSLPPSISLSLTPTFSPSPHPAPPPGVYVCVQLCVRACTRARRACTRARRACVFFFIFAALTDGVKIKMVKMVVGNADDVDGRQFVCKQGRRLQSPGADQLCGRTALAEYRVAQHVPFIPLGEHRSMS